MRKIEDSNIDFEILISTQSQTSLDFLNPMFDGLDCRDYNILIINQNINSPDLISTYPTIRVINSKASGLAKSRNLAIQNCLGQICLFADDDVVYKHDFKQKIISSFESQPNADIITFKMEDEFGNDYVKYPIKEIRHNHKSVLSAYSVVISFRKKTVKYKLKFDTLFGLGSEFPTGEEYVFLREALYRQKCLYFVPKIILKHPEFSSGRQETSDDILSSRAALFYKFSGNLAFIKLFKLLIILIFRKKLSVFDFVNKYFLGIIGIRKYKALNKKSKFSIS